MKKYFFYLYLLLFSTSLFAAGEVTVSGAHASSNGNYDNLRLAFAAINGQTQTGNTILVTITVAGTITDNATAVLNADTWTSLKIYPTVSGVILSGSVAAPLIDLNGADNVTIDGDVGGDSSTKDLVITNTSTSTTAGTSTIRFISDASSNTIKNCVIKGSTMADSGASANSNGIISIMTATTTGNDNNLITNNDITNAGGRPKHAIFAYGTSAKENNGNTISNNNIYDFFNSDLSAKDSNGIFLSKYNTDWTLSNNNFYETSPFAATAAPAAGARFYVIQIDYNLGVFTVEGNSIGGSAASCSGTWTKTAFNTDFRAISIIADPSTASSVNNNTIKGFDWTNTGNSSWVGLNIAGGKINVGTSSGNTIGSSSTNDVIKLTSGANGATLIGIRLTTDGTVTCSNNTIGSLTAVNGATFATHVYGITKDISAGTIIISGNLIGSATQSNSIQASTASTANNQNVYGIYNRGTDGVTISNNTIYNLNNASTRTGSSTVGIRFEGSAGVNLVNANFIHSLTASGASTPATISGIRIIQGTATYSNNIIYLGSSTANTINGIYEMGAGNTSLYYNTVFISGVPTSDVLNSYALYSKANTNTRDFRNNIFYNARSNNGATGKHYAAFFNYATTGTLTLDYNDYYYSGGGGVLGQYNEADVQNLPLIATFDGNSRANDPRFASAGGMLAANYIPSTVHAGVAGTGITADYAGTLRSSLSVGAYEAPLDEAVKVYIRGGALQASYSTLKDAFAAFNAGTHSGGDFDIKLYAGHVTASAVLTTASTYDHIYIYPTISGISILGNLEAPLIDLDGADNVFIDGRIDETGAPNSLSLINGNTTTTAGTSTIRFINDASNNTVRYCTIRGSSTNITSPVTFATGTILFSNTNASTGNDDNIIEYNTLTNAYGNRPFHCILSTSDQATKMNSGLIIRNNTFYDFIVATGANANYYTGVCLYTNTTTSQVVSNNFYETQNLVAGSANSPYFSIIYLNSTGSGFTVNSNSIGGNAAAFGGGGKWTKTAALVNNCRFSGIEVNVGTAVATEIQGNVIKNFTWNVANINPWRGILITAGAANIGTTSPNIIGSLTEADNINVTFGGTADDANAFGININTPGNVVCKYNQVGGITIDNGAFYGRVIGIRKLNTSGSIDISNNTIGNLLNKGTSADARNMTTGIHIWTSPTTGTNVVANNFINLLSATGEPSAVISGIYIESGTTTYSNNIVSLGGNTPSTIYGIYESGAATHNNNIYFNSISIHGAPTTGAANSYALWSNASTNTRNFRNNIFYNVRSNGGTATGKHYAIGFNYAVNTNLTLDYNDYTASGTGGVLGYYNAGDVATLPIVASNDSYSITTAPSFSDATSITATDYQPGADLPGVRGTGILVDYIGTTRTTNNPTSMGAWERALTNTWVGSSSTDWATRGNWSYNLVPDEDDLITFDAAPSNHCVMDASHSVYGVTNPSDQSLEVNGKTLTIKNALSFTGAGRIDATTVTPSTLAFAGSALQTIPANVFLSNKVYNLTINNAANVKLYGTLDVTNVITASSGRLDGFTESPTLIYSGAAAQTVGAAYLDDKVYNLTANAFLTISPDSTFNVTHTLTVNAGKRITIPVNKLLKVDNSIGSSVVNNAGTSGIWIKSKSTLVSTDANGSFIFPQTSTVLGTVEMFSKASWDLSQPSGSKYKWQFMGLPLASGVANDYFYGSYVRKHNEAGTGAGPTDTPTKRWLQLSTYSTMSPYVGYEVVYPTNKVYYFYGQLVNADRPATALSYTGTAEYPGQHIIGNSYTAAIDIKELLFTGDAEAAVYLYNTGSYSEWSSLPGNGGNVNGDLPGQYTAVPKNAAGTAGIPRQIPSMQGFLVKVTSGANTFAIPYVAATSTAFGRNRDVQRAPSASQGSSDSLKSYTVVDLKARYPLDKVWLFTVEDTHSTFDNGWDGRKMLGNPQAPQLFVRQSDGDYQVNTSDNLHNTDLAFQGMADSTYTMTFNHTNIQEGYDELYLLDLATNAVTDISESGASYTFDALATAVPETRFRIVTSMAITTDLELENSSDKTITLYQSKGTVFVKNTTNEAGLMQIVDMRGVNVMRMPIAASGLTVVPTALSSGAYVVLVSAGLHGKSQKIVVE